MVFKRELNVACFTAASSSKIEWYTLSFFCYVAITSPQHAVFVPIRSSLDFFFFFKGGSLNSVLKDKAYRQGMLEIPNQ